VANYGDGQTPQYGKVRDPALDKGDFVFKVGGIGAAGAIAEDAPGGSWGAEEIAYGSITVSAATGGIVDVLRGGQPVYRRQTVSAGGTRTLSNMEAGEYEVRIDYGDKTEQRWVTVRNGSRARVDFTWTEPPPRQDETAPVLRPSRPIPQGRR
jgi:hypothetical protein